jgi:hypothetical protein
VLLVNLGLIHDPALAPEEIEEQRQHTWYQYAKKVLPKLMAA